MKERNNLGRIKEMVLPFEWEDFDTVDYFANNYYDVVFLEDFGAIKSGDKFECITVDCEHGFIEIYNEAGDKIILRQYFKGIPCESENNIS
jgi:hypothetical protein